ncbi:hypothetical protein QU481_18225, partial [Crenobacter sp. SG2303]
AQTVSLRGHLHDAGTFFWAKLMVVGGHGNTLSGCCTWGWKPPIQKFSDGVRVSNLELRTATDG